MNVLALCAGVGGLELGIRLAMPTARTVCYVEREAFCAAILVERMAQGYLDPASIWSDLASFDARPWRGAVDLICAGLPCQPYSLAGKRRGNDDERAIWPELVRIVRECEPAGVFLENVPAFLAHAKPVWRELRGLGFRWAPPLVLGAAHVGAPHLRKRVWMLATHIEYPRELQSQGRQQEEWGRSCYGSLEDAVRDLDCKGFKGSSQYPNNQRWTDTCQRGWWSTEPDVVRVVHGVPDGVDRIRALGNGVVPLVAAHAFRTLMTYMTEQHSPTGPAHDGGENEAGSTRG